MTRETRLLQDAPDRSYASKLAQFALFAAPELRGVITDLALPSTGVAIDLGCGTGHTTALLTEVLDPSVLVVGLDLSRPHLQVAQTEHDLRLVQADAERLCFKDGTIDLIWCCNTVNHFGDQVAKLRALRRSLRKGGVLALAQSGFLPEMFFAWDAPLDEAVRLACHRYYRDRYGLETSQTAGIRGIVGLLQTAGFGEIRTRTYVIERTQPLSTNDRNYLEDTVFKGTWGERIWPYLEERDRNKLARYCDPTSPDYCLERPDFHHVQTLTVCQTSR